MALPWAITFRAFGAVTQSFDTDSKSLGYSQPSAKRTNMISKLRNRDFCAKPSP